MNSPTGKSTSFFIAFKEILNLVKKEKSRAEICKEFGLPKLFCVMRNKAGYMAQDAPTMRTFHFRK